MKPKLVLSLLFCVLCLNSTFSQKQPDKPNSQTNTNNNQNNTNASFYNDDPDFMIYFLNQKPTKSESEIDTDLGRAVFTTYMYEQSGTVAYMAAKAIYDKSRITGINAKERVKKAQEGFNGQLGLTVTEEKEIKLGRYPGLFFKSSSTTYYNVAAVYLVDNILYQIAILRADRAPTEQEIQDFIYSFSLK